jgi:transcriptional regulator with XRE-family HTH domain
MSSDIRKEFGARVISLMTQRGIKAKQIVESSDGLITYQNLWIWKHGICFPRVESLLKLAEILSVSIDSLLGRRAANG